MQKITFIQLVQSIASGVFGKEAFTGGTATAAWGVLFHYCIAFLCASFYWLFFSSSRLIRTHYITTGLLYGVFVWIVMNLAVVPLSNTAHRSLKLNSVIIGMTILVVCIGLPISIIIKKYAAPRPAVQV